MFVAEHEPKQRLLSRRRVLTRSSRPSSTHSRLCHNLSLIRVSLSFYAPRVLGHNDIKTFLTTTNAPDNATRTTTAFKIPITNWSTTTQQENAYIRCGDQPLSKDVLARQTSCQQRH